jgi:hypothetical protein
METGRTRIKVIPYFRKVKLVAGTSLPDQIGEAIFRIGNNLR